MVDLNSPGMRVKPRRSSGRVSKRRSSISRPSPLVANSVSADQDDRPNPTSLPRSVSKSEKSAFTPAKPSKKVMLSPASRESLEIGSSFDFVEEMSENITIKLKDSSAEKMSVQEAGGVEQDAASGQRARSTRAHASRDSTVLPTRKSVTRQSSAGPSGQATRSKSLRERKSSENQKKEELNPKADATVRRRRVSPRKQLPEAQDSTGRN